MMIDQDAYNRDVLAHLDAIEREDDTMLNDLKAEGVEADIRRAAVDGIIAKMWDRQLVEFCSAMRIAGVTAQQTAQVMKVLDMIQNRGRL